MRELHEAWNFDHEHQEYVERHRLQRSVRREFEQQNYLDIVPENPAWSSVIK